MREIKFRGKEIDGGDWVYGYYLYSNNEHKIHYPKDNISYRMMATTIVVPESVGQYTSKKDKYVREIYEGDVVRFKNGYQYVIKDIEHFFWAMFDDQMHLEFHKGEIIGNIYDNPELLEEG